jgi:CheY-like chemotaxis protein/anti-sigma regulatory factor (Ser/Thr protein kinase)
MSSPVDAPTETDRHQRSVLVVDDSAVDRHLVGGIIQKLDGWHASFAANGREALDSMGKAVPDLVLTDMLMDEMDGLELVQAVRSKYPGVPVILMTAHGSEDVAIQALQKGAASYVPKKSMARDLDETIEQVYAAAKTGQSQRRVLDCLTQQESHFILENDTTLISPLVGYLEDNVARLRLCEQSGLVLLGVALHEALTNAILHGNLGVDSALREVDEKKYQRLIQERQLTAPYRDRRVHVTATLNRREARFVIRDDGDGFDPGTLPDPTDPSNLGRVSGRGLLLIQTFMDHVEHNEKGNEITMIKRCGA